MQQCCKKERAIDITLVYILIAALLSGVVSLTVAALLSYKLLSQVVERMVSLSVGIMLSIAMLHSLPEAFESGIEPQRLFMTLLFGLFGFFLLEKLSIIRHSHHHEHDGHHHHPGFDARSAGKSGWLILAGDGMHNLTDGIMIAAAFLADERIGCMTTLAIMMHEIPLRLGDFIVLLNAGFTRLRAGTYNLISSLLTVVGGLVGYFALANANDLIPYALVLASSGFIYIAVSDLMPQMQRNPKKREAALQVLLVTLGVVIVLLLTGYVHHAH